MHLNLVDDIHAVLAVDHIDSKPSSAKASCAANPVKVCLIVGVPFHVHREVKVDHQCHLFHIDSCNQQNHKWVYVQLQTWRSCFNVNMTHRSHLWSTRLWSPAPSPCHSCSDRWLQLSAPRPFPHSAMPPGGPLWSGLKSAKKPSCESEEKVSAKLNCSYYILSGTFSQKLNILVI